jgi:endoglucanase
VAAQEVVRVSGVGAVLIPGPEGFHSDAKIWFVNPSYAPPELLAYFAKRDPAGPWKDLLLSLPAVLQTENGFAMNWMQVGTGGIRASLRPSGISEVMPVGSYDAIRVYLWLGMADPKTDGVRQSMAEMKGMTAYLKSHAFPPELVSSSGKWILADAPVGFSAAVIPFLRAEGMKKEEQTQQNRLVALRDDKTGLLGKDAAYYDQNLALFATGWTEERFRFEVDGRLLLKSK